MISCKVCNAENDEFATVCRNCKSFIQNRITNLDFFDTVWKVIESPRKAFHDITLAQHKNYSLLLFSFFGVALSLTGFWYFRLGPRFDSLLNLLGEATLIGVGLGIVASALFTFVFHWTARAFGGKGTLQDSLGTLAYSTTPVSISLFLILPVELLTFGMYLFTSNPDPYSIKPTSFVALVAFDALMGLWSFILFVVGGTVSKQISPLKSLISALVTSAICLGALFSIAKELVHYV